MKFCLYVDTVVDPDQAAEFMNSLNLLLPPYNLRLKIGSSIILLRNLNAPKLCNGTRLVIKVMGNDLMKLPF